MQQRSGSCRIVRHRECKCSFGCNTRTGRSKLQSLYRRPLGFAHIAISGFALCRERQPYCPIFLAIDPNRRVHSPLGKFPGRAEMTRIRLGVGVERKRLTDAELVQEATYLVDEKGLRVLELVYASDPLMRVDTMCRHVELLRNVLGIPRRRPDRNQRRGVG